MKGAEYDFGLKTLKVYVYNVLPWPKKNNLFIVSVEDILVSLRGPNETSIIVNPSLLLSLSTFKYYLF